MELSFCSTYLDPSPQEIRNISSMRWEAQEVGTCFIPTLSPLPGTPRNTGDSEQDQQGSLCNIQSMNTQKMDVQTQLGRCKGSSGVGLLSRCRKG